MADPNSVAGQGLPSNVSLTEYIVLEAVVDDKSEFVGWRQAGVVTARDATAAIRQHLDGKSAVDSTFVATPARSWRPQRVMSRVALDFGEAS